MSFIEIGIKGGGPSAFSGLYALNFFKILRSLEYCKSFNLLIESIIHTLQVLGNYCFILGLFIYIYSLLGMQFFAGKLKFNESGQYDPVNGQVPR